MVLEKDQWSVKLHNGTNDLGDQERRAREQQIWREQEKRKINHYSGCKGDILKTKQVMTEIKRLIGSVWSLDLRKDNTAICHLKFKCFTPDSVIIYIAHMLYALFIEKPP